ncbi:MAG: SGNH/GDSL hydrolase family protein [Candidatus Omnitrophica bacterium]|nr:SGNH/GDSL hydrolase family protein [Candidatus Omnitrophota bacterium]
MASLLQSASFASGEDFLLQDGQTVLFQGDSITDAGRDRDDPKGLGKGYPSLLAPWISAAHPDRKIEFLNRGNSGNRVVDLQERWDKDCLDLKPDWLSILIGVNDTWRRYDRDDPTSVEDFEAGYRKLLDRCHEKLECQFVLLEPFLLNVSDKIWKMREDLDPKREAVRRIAEEYNTLFIPLDDLFQEASKHRDPAFWAADGVHPTPNGHALIAQAWLNTVGA